MTHFYGSVNLSRILASLAIFLVATALRGQTATDTIAVTLKQHVRMTFKNNGCQVYVLTSGTHPDPVGNGRDADYTYFGTLRGAPRTVYNDPSVPAWTGIRPDDPGKYISYTVGYSWSLSPRDCNYDLPEKSAQSVAQLRQYARFTMPIGIRSFFTSSSNQLVVCFDATNSGSSAFCVGRRTLCP